MLHKFSTFILLVLPLSIFAQIDSFHIAEYVRPDLERRIFAITGDAVLYNYSSARNKTPLEHKFYLSPFLRLTHSKLQNSAKVQKTVSNTSSNSFRYNKQNNEIDTVAKWYNLNLDYEYNANVKKFDTKQQFFEMDYDIDLAYSANRSKDQWKNDISRGRRLTSNLSITPYLGKGRIELISDAWHAKTMLRVLEKAGFLKKNITAAEIQAFAEQISIIKNMRNTDNRLEDIAEFETLCAFLIDHKIVSATDFNFFALLHDAWINEAVIDHNFFSSSSGYGLGTYLSLQNSGTPQFWYRYHGQEFKVGINPSIGITDYNYYSNSPNRTYANAALGGVLAFNKYKAISDNWQFNQQQRLTVRPAFAGLLQQENIGSYNNNLIFELASSWLIHYLPTRRTNYSLALDARYLYNINNTIIYDRTNKSILNSTRREYGRLNLDINARMNHYFSPRFNIVVNLNLNLDFDTESSSFSPLSRHPSQDLTLGNVFDVRMNYFFF